MTVRAAVLHGPRDLRIDRVPIPVPGPGEVRLRVEAALTGGTTAKIFRRGYHARLGRPPLRLGHEGAGTIDAVGTGVEKWRPRMRVVAGNSASCGECTECRRGMTAQCRDMTWLTGFLAEAIVVPARIVSQNLHEIPQGMEFATAALAENLAAVLKGHDRTPGRAGERAVVLGTGPIGLLWTRVLSLAGVEVTVVGRRPERGAVAKALGAWAALSTAEFEERLAGGEGGYDLAVEAVGTPETWADAIRAVRPGGRVHLFGGPPHGTTISFDAGRLHYDEVSISSSFHHTPYHFAEALHLLERGFVDPALLLEERLPLADLPRHLRRLFEGGGPLKAVVEPTRG
jgi:L-iditol 2-dehydrogenase